MHGAELIDPRYKNIVLFSSNFTTYIANFIVFFISKINIYYIFINKIINFIEQHKLEKIRKVENNKLLQKLCKIKKKVKNII